MAELQVYNGELIASQLSKTDRWEMMQCAQPDLAQPWQGLLPNGTGLRNWFAVYTRSHHEKRVVEHLSQRGIVSFLPLYKAEHQWSNRRKATLDLPLFPNYLFVHIAPGERGRAMGTPGVVSLVRHGHVDSVLGDCEIEQLRSGLHLRRVEPHPHLAAGTRARIVAGPLAGFEGIVLRKKGGLRVVISVALILQSVSVEVDADELEPCSVPLRN